MDEIAVGRLEDGVVEEDARAALAELAREEQVVAFVEAPLHELPAVPLGLGRARPVRKVCRDDLDAAASGSARPNAQRPSRVR